MIKQAFIAFLSNYGITGAETWHHGEVDDISTIESLLTGVITGSDYYEWKEGRLVRSSRQVHVCIHVSFPEGDFVLIPQEFTDHLGRNHLLKYDRLVETILRGETAEAAVRRMMKRIFDVGTFRWISVGPEDKGEVVPLAQFPGLFFRNEVTYLDCEVPMTAITPTPQIECIKREVVGSTRFVWKKF